MPSLVLCDLRRTGPYVAVAFVGDADDAFWGDLAADYLERCRDRTAFEKAFACAEGDWGLSLAPSHRRGRF